jgi:hypothetical protein
MELNIDNPEDDISAEDGGNIWLAKVIGCSTRQITRYREQRLLPRVGTPVEGLVAFLFELARNPPVTADLDQLKLEEQIKKLQIENEIKLGKYIEKDKAYDYFSEFAGHTKKTIIDELEKLESDIICPTEYKETNIKTIRSGRNSILGLLAAFKDIG